MKTKKPNIKLVIITAIIALLIMGGATAFGLVAYSNFQAQQKITAEVDEVADKYVLFEKAETEEEKLSLLEEMISEYESYVSDKSSDEYIEEVAAEYEKSFALMRKYFTDGYDRAIDENTVATLDEAEPDDIKASITNLTALNEQITKEADVTIADEKKLKAYTDEINGLVNEMRQHFADEYDKVIKENTLDEVDKITDKEKLSAAIKNLDELKKLVESEGDITLGDADKADEYKDAIGNLVESYQQQIKDIEEAEAEEKKQEEEKQQEAQQEYESLDNGYNDYEDSQDDNSEDGSDDNAGDYSDDWHGGLNRIYTNYDTGVITYYYNDGYCYDTNGYEGNWKDLQ